MAENLFRGNDKTRELDRKASEFAWHDATEDLLELDRIAERHNPNGEFHLIEDFHIPKDADGEVTIQMSPTLVDWLRWLAQKYDLDTAFVILTKFTRNFFVGADDAESGQTTH